MSDLSDQAGGEPPKKSPSLEQSIGPELSTFLGQLPEEKRGDFLRKIADIVSRVPASDQPHVMEEVTEVIAQFSGPLPTPQMLAEYDAKFPGLGTTIIGTMTSETAHRRKMELRQQMFDFIGPHIPRVIGAIAALCMLFGAVWVADDGHDWVAGIIAGTDLLGVVTVLVTMKNQRVQNTEDNQEVDPGE